MTALGFSSQIDQYEIIGHPLHEDEICTVFLAEHKVTGLKAAIKRINKESFYAHCEIQKVVEANILAQCKHSNIVTLIEYFSTKTEIYIITEYQAGGDLKAMLLDEKTMDEQLCKMFALDIAEGLKYLHQKGIVHRDIKLNNIMISNRNEEGIARIADFGFSTRIAPGEKLTGILGTLGYMAPEMVQGHPYN